MSFLSEPEEEWMKKAKCLDADPDAFFPEKGQQSLEAKAVCAVCPVQVECLDFAVREDIKFGIWGGENERQIRRIRDRERRHRDSLRDQRGRH